MAVIKPDPDSVGESCPTSSHNENELLELKEGEDHSLKKYPVMKFESELNIDTVKHETCMLAALNEADVEDMKHGDLSASPFCLIKCEMEVNVNSINSVPDSDNGVEKNVLKEEVDPLLVTLQDTQGRNECVKMDEELEGICTAQTGFVNEPHESCAGCRFPCHVCKKLFSKQSSVKSHIRIHTGERPFLCIICNKLFNEQSNLKRHVRVHTGEHPY